MPTSYYSEQRSQYGLFGREYLRLASSLFVLNSSDIKSFSQLNVKKLALVAGDATINLIREKFPKIKIIETVDINDSINRLLSGEVDAAFELDAVMTARIKNGLVQNIETIHQHEFPACVTFFFR